MRACSDHSQPPKNLSDVVRANIRHQTTLPPMSRVVILVAILLACTQLKGQGVSPHAQDAVQTIRQLRAIGLPNFEDGHTGPPARVPRLLRQLNQQLRALITDTLNDRSRLTVASQAEVIGQLQAAGWDEIPEPEMECIRRNQSDRF